MPIGWVALAGAATSLIGGAMNNSASGDAADAQRESAQLGIGEQRRQFSAVQELLAPYVRAGSGPTFDAEAYLRANPDVAADPYFGANPYQHYLQHGQQEGRAKPMTGGGPGSLSAQQDLLGLNGAGAQGAAISGIEKSPLFGALARQGEDGILQNASATGGLRGGNTQGALAQFRPSLLSALIDQQYSRLGGITSLGQNAAAGVGNAGMQTGNAVTSLLQQQGAAQAGGILAGNRATVGAINGVANGVGAYYGLRGQPNNGGGIPSGPAGQYYTGGVAGDSWNSGYDLPNGY